MARRPKPIGLESAADLARKMEILEREMATQRAALDRLKQLGREPDHGADSPSSEKRGQA